MIFDNWNPQLIKLALQTEEERKRKDREYHQKKRDEEKLTGGVSLKPHQIRVHEKLKHSPGVLVYHGLGSGKTITSISAADALGLPAEAVVPAALRPNYLKEIAKVKPKSHFDVKSYDEFSKRPSPHGRVLIFDEVQRLQDPSARRTATALATSPAAVKRIGLSGTPIQNKPSEIAAILNVLAGKRVLPMNDEFDARFVREAIVRPSLYDRLIRKIKPGIKKVIHRESDFRRAVKGLVDYHPSVAEGFPSSSSHVIDVPMSDHQAKVYKHVTERLDRSFWNKVERNLPPDKKESANLNAFMSAARQVSNTPAPYHAGMSLSDSYKHSPKFQRIVHDLHSGIIHNPKFKGVIYSNYLKAGVAPISHELSRRGIKHHVFTGGMSDKRRKQMVDDYNHNRVSALLISGAGAEGLDLKGTRMIQVVEPHWNESRIKQVIGRGIRYQSHAHLPEHERHVEVRHYHSTHKPSFMQRAFNKKQNKTSADQYLATLAKNKQELIDQFLNILKEEGSQHK